MSKRDDHVIKCGRCGNWIALTEWNYAPPRAIHDDCPALPPKALEAARYPGISEATARRVRREIRWEQNSNGSQWHRNLPTVRWTAVAYRNPVRAKTRRRRGTGLPHDNACL